MRGINEIRTAMGDTELAKPRAGVCTSDQAVDLMPEHVRKITRNSSFRDVGPAGTSEGNSELVMPGRGINVNRCHGSHRFRQDIHDGATD